MRLINATTLQLEEFVNSSVTPKYAILSHRWEKNVEEITMQQMLSDHDKISDIKGYLKIKGCCEEAIRQGLEYVWVDTCCIDKSSSAELSEAINSMFRWYKEAEVCFAYLSDIHDPRMLDVKKSLWFTRGWTLQELIAPRRLMFFSSNWTSLGEREDYARQIEAATGIDEGILRNESDVDLTKYTVARKMSWAANRHTSRTEDIAYCLLGLFDVNMPLLYGEGDKAFKRLQEAIILQTYDPTIFTWIMPSDHDSGILASSPNDFQRYALDEPHHALEVHEINKPQAYPFTALGLSLRATLFPWVTNVHAAMLDCRWRGRWGSWHTTAIFVRRSMMGNRTLYWRTCLNGVSVLLLHCDESVHTTKPENTHPSVISHPQLGLSGCEEQNIYLHLWGKVPNHLRQIQSALYDFKLTMNLCDRDAEFRLVGGNWDINRGCIWLPHGQCGTVAVVESTSSQHRLSALKLGFDSGFNPVCILGTGDCNSLITTPDDNHVRLKRFCDVNCKEVGYEYEPFVLTDDSTAPFMSESIRSVAVGWCWARLPANGNIALRFFESRNWSVFLCDEKHSRCSAGKLVQIQFRRCTEFRRHWHVDYSVQTCECPMLARGFHRDNCVLSYCRQRPSDEAFRIQSGKQALMKLLNRKTSVRESCPGGMCLMLHPRPFDGARAAFNDAFDEAAFNDAFDEAVTSGLSSIPFKAHAVP